MDGVTFIPFEAPVRTPTPPADDTRTDAAREQDATFDAMLERAQRARLRRPPAEASPLATPTPTPQSEIAMPQDAAATAQPGGQAPIEAVAAPLDPAPTPTAASIAPAPTAPLASASPTPVLAAAPVDSTRAPDGLDGAAKFDGFAGAKTAASSAAAATGDVAPTTAAMAAATQTASVPAQAPLQAAPATAAIADVVPAGAEELARLAAQAAPAAPPRATTQPMTQQTADDGDAMQAVPGKTQKAAPQKAKSIGGKAEGATGAEAGTTPAQAAPSAAARTAAAPLQPIGDAVASAANAQPAAAAPAGSAESARAQAGGATASTADARAPAPAQQVAQAIVRKFNGQSTRFEVRLDPPELGKIQVRIDVQRDHSVTAAIAADDAGALTQLARAAREIADALQAAGLNLSEDGLSFSLADQGDANAFAERERSRAPTHAVSTSHNDDALPRTARLERWHGARLDVIA